MHVFIQYVKLSCRSIVLLCPWAGGMGCLAVVSPSALTTTEVGQEWDGGITRKGLWEIKNDFASYTKKHWFTILFPSNQQTPSIPPPGPFHDTAMPSALAPGLLRFLCQAVVHCLRLRTAWVRQPSPPRGSLLSRRKVVKGWWGVRRGSLRCTQAEGVDEIQMSCIQKGTTQKLQFEYFARAF